jgi:hypothetical protein
MAQIVDHLPSKCEDLSSNPITTHTHMEFEENLDSILTFVLEKK